MNIDNNIYMVEIELDKLKKILKQNSVDKNTIDNQIKTIKWELYKLEMAYKKNWSGNNGK